MDSLFILSDNAEHLSYSITNIVFNELNAIGNDEYQVYSDVLLQMMDNHPALFVIKQFTDNSRVEDNTFSYFEKKTLIKIDLAMVEDFKKKNAKTYKLENLFFIPQRVVMISDQEIKKIFRDFKGWERFYKRYSDSQGIIELSRIGFNGEKNQALLYYGKLSDWQAGIGYLIYLLKEEARWKIKGKVMIWIS